MTRVGSVFIPRVILIVAIGQSFSFSIDQYFGVDYFSRRKNTCPSENIKPGRWCCEESAVSIVSVTVVEEKFVVHNIVG